jgi:hypothetical protein
VTAVVLGMAAGAVLVAGALVPLLRRGPGLRAARARARSAHARLGHLLATVAADPDTARRARERWTTTGALLAHAATAEDLALAERTAAEGIGLLTGL